LGRIKQLVDLELIKMVKKNNKQAFKILFNNHKDKVARTAFLILRDRNLVEDIVQEAFIQVFLKVHKLSELQLFEGWLYKITVNLCLKQLKKQRNLSAVSLDEYKDIGFEANTKIFTPEDIVIAKDTKVKMLNAIYSLPSKYTAVIILYYYNNFSIKEISAILKETESNVKTKLFRGRKILGEALKEEGICAEHSLEGGTTYECR
jgi:RNA polymerase sigma-70 factor, ECF subfamily